MPLFNQPQLNVGDIDIAANPYIDWKQAEHYYKRVTIDNAEIASVESDGQSGSVYTYDNDSTTWSFVESVFTNPPTVVWDGVAFARIPLDKPDFVIVKQAVYVIPQPEYTDSDMLLYFLEGVGQNVPFSNGTSGILGRGLMLNPGGYWESNTPNDSSIVFDDVAESVTDHGRIAGIYVLYGNENDSAGSGLELTGKLTFNYNYVIAPYIES